MAIELKEIAPQRAPSPSPAKERKSLFSVGSTVTSADRRFFTEQLGMMLETGANLHMALKLLQDQNQNPAMGRVLEKLEQSVAGGRAFSAALAEHPEVFSTTYVNLVAASEGGGFMHEVLAELLRMEEQTEELRSTVKSAFAYPAFLTLFSLAVIIFVLVVVFPKFSVMFARIHDQLPTTTVILMAASEFLRSYWIHTVAAMAFAAAIMRQWAISPPGRATIDRLKVTLPGIRHVFMQIYLTQSLRVMSLSLSNGVNITDAIAATRDVVANDILRRFFTDVENKVRQGSGLAIGFRQSDLIPLLVERMIATAEESGNLAKVMSRLADYYEQQLTRRLKSFSKMIEPIMLLIMGVVVGIIVASLVLPIFKLSRAVT